MSVSPICRQHLALRFRAGSQSPRAKYYSSQPLGKSHPSYIWQRHDSRTILRDAAPIVRAKSRSKSQTPYSHIRHATTTTSTRSRNAEVEAGIVQLEQDCQNILGVDVMPTEKDVLNILSKAENLAAQLLHTDAKPQPLPVSKTDSAVSALLAIQESESARASAQTAVPDVRALVDQLSNHTTSLLLFPPTFITPKILESYVNLHFILQRPETLPTILYLYANKPVPNESSSPVTYSQQKKDAASNAIPLPIADRALQTAIETKQLSIAMDIVGTSYATPAARKAKFIRKALLPITGLAAAPVAAYAIATSFSLYQSTMDPQMATNIAFVGMLSYVGFTTTIGVIAITTANDQMDRVTWATGLPLRERWLREEERSAIDKIAVAWGFRQTWRRGEEEGEDWDTLREWIGRKGMVLDRSSLLEGME